MTVESKLPSEIHGIYMEPRKISNILSEMEKSFKKLTGFLSFFSDKHRRMEETNYTFQILRAIEELEPFESVEELYRRYKSNLSNYSGEKAFTKKTFATKLDKLNKCGIIFAIERTYDKLKAPGKASIKKTYILNPSIRDIFLDFENYINKIMAIYQNFNERLGKYQFFDKVDKFMDLISRYILGHYFKEGITKRHTTKILEILENMRNLSDMELKNQFKDDFSQMILEKIIYTKNANNLDEIIQRLDFPLESYQNRKEFKELIRLDREIIEYKNLHNSESSISELLKKNNKSKSKFSGILEYYIWLFKNNLVELPVQLTQENMRKILENWKSETILPSKLGKTLIIPLNCNKDEIYCLSCKNHFFYIFKEILENFLGIDLTFQEAINSYLFSKKNKRQNKCTITIKLPIKGG